MVPAGPFFSGLLKHGDCEKSLPRDTSDSGQDSFARLDRDDAAADEREDCCCWTARRLTLVNW